MGAVEYLNASRPELANAASQTVNNVGEVPRDTGVVRRFSQPKESAGAHQSVRSDEELLGQTMSLLEEAICAVLQGDRGLFETRLMDLGRRAHLFTLYKLEADSRFVELTQCALYEMHVARSIKRTVMAYRLSQFMLELRDRHL